MRVYDKDYQAVFWDRCEQAVCWIEQRGLPHRFDIIRSRKAEDVACAIETMAVRGAPTIGATAAYGLALAWKHDRKRFFAYWLARFRRTRPTAVNLFHACDTMEQAALRQPSAPQMMEQAEAYAEREIRANRIMGEIMAGYLAVGERRILTHCNAGWLAAVDWGTATAGIYHLHRAGESPLVWVDETRPRLQGARLTAWELQQEGVHCCIQPDGAAAWAIARGEVDAIVVGADRIARNGDVANKIGTYALSLAAREHDVPMYVVAPSSTFDMQIASGRDIPIEQRSADEVLGMDGVDDQGISRQIRIAADVPASNPAFDVTPFTHIRAIVSERGVYEPPSD